MNVFLFNSINQAGLAQTVEVISKKVNLKFPRAYKISDQRTLNDFKKDYRLTAVLGSLKIILDSKISQKIIFNANGTVSCNNKLVLKRSRALRLIVSV